MNIPYIEGLENNQKPDWKKFWGCVLILVGCVLVWCLVIAAIFLGCIAKADAGNFTASWYSEASCKREGTSGIWTASGERFDENALTCAMRSRDFGKYYKVTNLDNGKSVIVRQNDFGPNKKLAAQGRIIDLSKGAFQRIASLKKGVIPVSIEEVLE